MEEEKEVKKVKRVKKIKKMNVSWFLMVSFMLIGQPSKTEVTFYHQFPRTPTTSAFPLFYLSPPSSSFCSTSSRPSPFICVCFCLWCPHSSSFPPLFYRFGRSRTIRPPRAQTLTMNSLSLLLESLRSRTSASLCICTPPLHIRPPL